MVKYLLDLREIRGTSFVLVSHDGAEMLSLADKVLCMKKGKIYRQGKPKDLYYKPRTIEEGKLFGPINSVQVGDKRVLFRPDEFRTEEGANEILLDLVFEKAIFNGTVYENYFRTFRKEVVMLYSIHNDLSHVNKGVIFKEK